MSSVLTPDVFSPNYGQSLDLGGAPSSVPSAPAVGGGTTSPTPQPAAPQPAPENNYDDVFQMIKKYVDYDPAKDPDVLAHRKSESEAIEEQKKYTRSFIQDVHDLTFMQQPPKMPTIATSAPEMQDFAVKTTPWLLTMMAIGGKFGKLTGGNMLGAMSGMLKGTMQGSQQAFDRAYKTWQDNYKLAVEDWRNKMEVYRTMMEARKGQIDAEGKAISMYRSIAGEEETAAKNIATEHSGYEKMIASLKAQDLKLQATRQNMESRVSDERLKIINAYNKATTNWPRLSAASAAMDRAFDLLPEVLRKYKEAQDNAGPMSPLPKQLSKWLISTGDPTLQAFASDLVSAKPILAALETSGTGSRSNMLLQAMISDTVPTNFYSLGPEQVQRLTQDAKGILDAAKKNSKANIDAYRKLGSEMGLDLPEPSAFQFPEEQVPMGAPKPASQGGGNEPTVSGW